MISLLLFSTIARAELNSSFHFNHVAPIGVLNGILYPGLSLDLQFSVPMNNLDIGVLLNSSLHNGLSAEYQEGSCDPKVNCIQGDSYVVSLGGYVGYHLGNTERMHLVPFLSLQMSAIPLLMNQEYYLSEIIPKWGNIPASIHEDLHPTIRGGSSILFPLSKEKEVC